MLIVGTDRMRVVGAAAAPDGTRHAVDAAGRVLCRASRARFTWPALNWEEQQGDEASCSLCIQVRVAQEAVSQEAVSQEAVSQEAVSQEAVSQEAVPHESMSQVPAYPIGSQAASPVATAAWEPAEGLFETQQA